MKKTFRWIPSEYPRDGEWWGLFGVGNDLAALATNTNYYGFVMRRDDVFISCFPGCKHERVHATMHAAAARRIPATRSFLARASPSRSGSTAAAATMMQRARRRKLRVRFTSSLSRAAAGVVAVVDLVVAE